MRTALIVLCLSLSLVGCSQVTQGLRVACDLLESTDKFVGYVCSRAEDVFDSKGIFWGVRFVAAALGEPCRGGGREINVSANLPEEIRKARSLSLGQNVNVSGDHTVRDLPPSVIRDLAAINGPNAFNDPIYARRIRLR